MPGFLHSVWLAVANGAAETGSDSKATEVKREEGGQVSFLGDLEAAPESLFVSVPQKMSSTFYSCDTISRGGRLRQNRA